MNVFAMVGKFFRRSGTLLIKAWQAADEAGLSEDIIAGALPLVRKAANKTLDDEQKRKWVIAALVTKFDIPARIAALAVELAYNLYRKEVGNKLDGK